MKPSYVMSARRLAGLLLLAVAVGAGIAWAAQRALPAVGAEERSIEQKETRKMGQPVVHFEIGCRDTAKTREFYSALFDWKIDPMGPAAATINTGASEGIQGHITALGHEPNHYVTVYVQVDDLKAALAKATSLGGKTLVPPVPIPTGHFAWIADPEGNLIGLLQPKAAPAK